MPARGQKVRDEALYASSLVTSLRCFVTGLTGSGWRSTCRCWIRQRCCCRHHRTCFCRHHHHYRCRRRRCHHSGRPCCRHRHRHRGGCTGSCSSDRCRHRSGRHRPEDQLRHLTDDQCPGEVRCSPFRPRRSPSQGLRRSPDRPGSSSPCTPRFEWGSQAMAAYAQGSATCVPQPRNIAKNLYHCSKRTYTHGSRER